VSVASPLEGTLSGRERSRERGDGAFSGINENEGGFIPRDAFVREIARRPLDTDYTNFKESVNDENTEDLKTLYDGLCFCGAQAEDKDQERPAGGDAVLRNLVPHANTVSLEHR
jgi:hypothetical protein